MSNYTYNYMYNFTSVFFYMYQIQYKYTYSNGKKLFKNTVHHLQLGATAFSTFLQSELVIKGMSPALTFSKLI